MGMAKVIEIKSGAVGMADKRTSVVYVTWLETKGGRKEGWTMQVGAHKFSEQFREP